MGHTNNNQLSNGNNNPFRNNKPSAPGRNSRLPSCNQNNNQGSRFGGSRFGSSAQSITWTLEPAFESAIRFDLKGLGDPYYRLLGERLDADCNDLDAFIKIIQEHADWYEKLHTKLNAS